MFLCAAFAKDDGMTVGDESGPGSDAAHDDSDGEIGAASAHKTITTLHEELDDSAAVNADLLMETGMFLHTQLQGIQRLLQHLNQLCFEA